MKTDETLDRLLKEVADENQLLTTQVRDAIEIYVQICMRKMRNWFPVLVPNFGTFYVSRNKTLDVLTSIFKAFDNHKKGLEGLNREEVIQRLATYWPVHNVARNHNPGRGVGYRYKLFKENGTLFKTKYNVWATREKS